MIDFITTYSGATFFVGVILFNLGWFSAIMYYHTMRYAIPIVRMIRAHGGKAPTISELKRYFSIVSLCCLLFAFTGYVLLSVNMYKHFVGSNPSSLLISLSDWINIYNRFGKLEFALFWFAVAGGITLLYTGKKEGAKNALAGIH